MMRESFHEISDVDENQHGIDGLGFDPDKLIEPETPFRDESYLSSPELVCYQVEGLGQTGQETRMLENGNSLFDSSVSTAAREKPFPTSRGTADWSPAKTLHCLLARRSRRRM